MRQVLKFHPENFIMKIWSLAVGGNKLDCLPSSTGSYHDLTYLILEEYLILMLCVSRREKFQLKGIITFWHKCSFDSDCQRLMTTVRHAWPFSPVACTRCLYKSLFLSKQETVRFSRPHGSWLLAVWAIDLLALATGKAN